MKLAAVLPLALACLAAASTSNVDDDLCVQKRHDAPASCTGGGPPAPSPSLSAADLVDKAIAAMGGKDALNALKGVQWNAK